MADKLQYNILNLEVTPPSGSWENLEGRLRSEFDPVDSRLSSRLEAFAVEPPESVFPYILLELHPRQEQRSPIRRKLAIAALVIGIAAVSALLMFQPGTQSTLAPSTTTPVTSIPKSPEPTKESLAVIPAAPLAKLARTDNDVTTSSAKRQARKYRATSAGSRVQYAENLNPVTSYADPDELHRVTTSQNISVVAPLIRDGSGKIILDASVITSSDKDYIIVTSPNGEQTRISKKFLNLLPHLNSSGAPFNPYSDGAEWRARFEEWRKLLLEKAAFVPSATNFMDIFELKEMMQEN